MNRVAPITVALLLNLLLGCSAETEEPASLPAPVWTDPADQGECDAGDEAFVRRALPVLIGRRAQGITEVDLMLSMTGQLGRQGWARLMSRHPDFVSHWRSLLWDILAVPRIHEPSNPSCYGVGLWESTTPDLARWVREHGPADANTPPSWTLFDLAASSFALGDITPVLRAHLFANLTNDVPAPTIEEARTFREYRAEAFLDTFLGRNMPCLACHNSDAAVTDRADPAADRHWPIGASFEQAVFGSSAGRPLADLIPYFRRKGVVSGMRYTSDPFTDEEVDAEIDAGVAPWGMSEPCGVFIPPADIPDDDRDESAWFVEADPKNASIWQLELRLRTGIEQLKDGSVIAALKAGERPTLRGPESFAFLVATSLANEVWARATGSRLVMPTAFPRNDRQRAILEHLAIHFVESGWSLSELVVAVVTHPYLNQLPPAECSRTDDFMAPVFDPMQVSALTPDALNGVGDGVHRLPARTIGRTITRAMGWAELPEFLLYYLSPAAQVQRDLGAFLKLSDRGFTGTGFQMALSFDANFGTCIEPVDPAECPLLPSLRSAGELTACSICARPLDEICGWDARCCDLELGQYCQLECGDEVEYDFDLSAFPKPVPGAGDIVTALLAQARDSGATWRQTLTTLKDRLLADPRIDDEAGEADVLSGLLGRGLDEPIGDDADADARLRRVCGVFLRSPQLMLEGVTLPPRAGERPGLELPGTSFEAVCQRTASQLGDAARIACTASTVSVEAVSTPGAP